MEKRYCLVYRTGGTENYKWHRSLAYQNKEDANIAKEANIKMGYPTYIVDYDQSINIGLPEEKIN